MATTTSANTATHHTGLLVIGWGKGGKTVAKQLGSAGQDVTLIEQDDHNVGGTCINIACVPTKALVHRAEEARPGDDLAETMASAWELRDDLTSRLREANRAMLATLDSVTLVHGRARFVGERTVEVTPVDGEGETLTVTADRVIVNTGTKPSRPDIPGADLPGVHDSSSIQLHLDTTTPPRRVAVVGAGPVGLEFASLLAGMGVEVSLLHRGAEVLPDEAPALRESMATALTDGGVRIVGGVSATAIEQDGDALTVRLDGGDDLTVDAVLFATGRTPMTAELGLDAGGIDTDERGYIVVDERLRTSAVDVWAVGDVNGGLQQTYISLDDGRIVMDQLTGEGTRSREDRVGVPTTIFTTPPFATLGMTEEQAREAGHSVLTATKAVAEVAAMPRPKAFEQTHGVLSFVVDADTDLILGARLHTIDAQELVNLVALAIRAGVTASQLRDGIWTHPSTTEALNEVLAELQ